MGLWVTLLCIRRVIHRKPEPPWQPEVAGKASGASLLCSRAIHQQSSLFISALTDSPLDPNKSIFARTFSMPFFPNVFLSCLCDTTGHICFPHSGSCVSLRGELTQGQIPGAVPCWQCASIEWLPPSGDTPGEVSFWHKWNPISLLCNKGYF